MPNDIVTKTTFCRICEALCGLQVDVDPDSNTVVDVRPDPDHVVTDGFACIKGLKQHEMYRSPDRLSRPLAMQADGSHVEVSWDDAMNGIGARVRQLRAEHGPDSIAMYVGTAAGFGALHPIFAQGFMNGIGSGNMYASATQDCANKFAVARHVYGFPFLQPFPDLDHIGLPRHRGCESCRVKVELWASQRIPVERIKDISTSGRQASSSWIPRRTETAKIGD